VHAAGDVELELGFVVAIQAEECTAMKQVYVKLCGSPESAKLAPHDYNFFNPGNPSFLK